MIDFASRILVEDDGLIAWNKPPGLVSTGRDLDDPDCAQYLAMTHYRRMIWAVHQLDAETSGILLFVRRKKLVSHWQQLLGAPSTTKEYLAIIHGRLDAPEVIVEAPIGRLDTPEGIRMAVRDDGKYARSDFRVLATSAHSSLLRVRIHTGRTHQIRVHLEHLGLSLYGEKRYRPAPCEAHPRHALHAHRILVEASCVPTLHAPIPQDFQELAGMTGTRTGLDLDHTEPPA